MSQVGKVGGIWRVICERLLNAEQGAVVYDEGNRKIEKNFLKGIELWKNLIIQI